MKGKKVEKQDKLILPRLPKRNFKSNMYLSWLRESFGKLKKYFQYTCTLMLNI